MPLPGLIHLDDCLGADTATKWPVYIETLYQVFCDALVDANLQFQGCPVKFRFNEPYDGKHSSFWHAITEGPVEENRAPDLERCCRIAWIAWVIQNADDPAHVRWWENQRPNSKHGTNTNVPLWLFNEDYAVVLQKREDARTGATFYFFVTSYCLKSGRRQQFLREWEAWNIA
jgi:hypothetical protein